jgi:hypothetical protein
VVDFTPDVQHASVTASGTVPFNKQLDSSPQTPGFTYVHARQPEFSTHLCSQALEGSVAFRTNEAISDPGISVFSETAADMPQPGSTNINTAAKTIDFLFNIA